MPPSRAEQPVVKLWEGLVLSTLPVLVVLIFVLQAHNVSRIITSALFVLLPFTFFPTMFVGDAVRYRVMARMAARRMRRQQAREARRQQGG